MLVGLVIAAFLIGLLVLIVPWVNQRLPRRSSSEECAFCGRRFSSTEALDKHVLEHLDVKRPTLSA